MSDMTKHRCDGCGKEVDDYCDEPGWVRIDGTFARYRGRTGKGMARSAFVDKAKPDYCSLDCLRAALDRLDQEADAKESERRLREHDAAMNPSIL